MTSLATELVTLIIKGRKDCPGLGKDFTNHQQTRRAVSKLARGEDDATLADGARRLIKAVETEKFTRRMKAELLSQTHLLILELEGTPDQD